MLVECKHLYLKYDNGPNIFEDVSFDIQDKSFQFLTGPSGAGKTSLLRLLFLSLKAQYGTLKVFNRDTSQLTNKEKAVLRRDIGIVFQDYPLLNHLNVYQNVALPHIVLKKDEASYKKDVLDLLDWVGLGGNISSYPQTLSSGEIQRAQIARAVISKPKILMADEPTGNVDPTMAKRLLRLFVELNKLGTAVVIATHDLSLIEKMPSRVLYISNKKINDYEVAV